MLLRIFQASMSLDHYDLPRQIFALNDFYFSIQQLFFDGFLIYGDFFFCIFLYREPGVSSFHGWRNLSKVFNSPSVESWRLMDFWDVKELGLLNDAIISLVASTSKMGLPMADPYCICKRRIYKIVSVCRVRE